MSMSERISEKLTQALQPVHLEVINESHMHRVPKNAETHFRVVVVSDHFLGLSLAERQRKVYGLLAEELKSGVHALAQRTYTPEEWKSRGEKDETPSPACLGRGKKA